MSTHITVMDLQSTSQMLISWNNCSKPLDQSKYHHTTNHSQDPEEVSYSCSCTLVLLTLSQDLVVGSTMTGSEQWSGIMNSWLLSTLDLSRLDISHSSSVQSSQCSTTYTQSTNSNNWPTNGLIKLSSNKTLTWDTPKNNSSIIELIKSTNSSRSVQLSTSSTTQNWMLMLTSTEDVSVCWTKFKTSRVPTLRHKWRISLMTQLELYSLLSMTQLMVRRSEEPHSNQH